MKDYNDRNTINIFYACDDNFIKYAIVSVKSLIENANKKYDYIIHFLHTNISTEMQESLKKLENSNFKIVFNNVEKELTYCEKLFPIRDYYTKTTYFRIFIANMFPEIDKTIYIDSDTIVLGDISELYFTEIGDNFVGACHEQAMVQVNEYGTYCEEVCGIDRNFYFNAGLLLLNCKAFRESNLLMKFRELLSVYNFRVTQDEDYLNVLCKDRVYWLNDSWNTEVFGEIKVPSEKIKIIHYIMISKPWHYDNCRLKEYFWHYAEKTEYYNEILKEFNEYPDEKKQKDLKSLDALLALAVEETGREDSYYKIVKKNRNKDREEVLNKIKEMEKNGVYDVDPENDPPTIPLKANTVDYLRKRPLSKLKSKISFHVANRFVARLRKNKKMIFKGVVGLENWKNLNSGAIITCNHFNPFDSFAIQLAYYALKSKKRKFYRVIREGNYTSFPGLYGFFMRNCNTLPLSSNLTVMKEFLKSVDVLLKNGHYILVYPEQAMWWNYRKPRPTKSGAFKFAVKNNVPVLPCFITMRDSDVLGDDGFYVQEYTVHVCTPIYPKKELSEKENIEYLKQQNDKAWKDVYEKTYMVSLSGVKKCI